MLSVAALARMARRGACENRNSSDILVLLIVNCGENRSRDPREQACERNRLRRRWMSINALVISSASPRSSCWCVAPCSPQRGRGGTGADRGKTIIARAISGRLFASSKEDRGNNTDKAEVARVHPFPDPRETMAELRTRLALAEERLTELKAMLEDMRRDRDAWREQAQTRLLPAPAAPMSWWRWLRATG
jgi:hypothetical protein